jgi:pyruvate formate lyase activating enzyme
MNGSCALQKLSLANFPETPCAVIFFSGCSLACGFCHNPGLIEAPFPDADMTFETCLDYVTKRRHLLKGVVFSGGEACLQSRLTEYAEAVHRLGLKVKLDTNGLHPEVLKEVPADHVAMDIKTLPSRYAELGCRFPDAEDRIRQSIGIICKSPAAFEFRTTLVPGLIDPEIFGKLCQLVPEGSTWYLQEFSPLHCLSSEYKKMLPMEMRQAQDCLQVLLDHGIKAAFRNT